MKSLMQSLRKTKRSQDQGASADAAAAKAPNNADNTTAAPGAARAKLLAYLRHVTWIIQVARRVPITSVLIVVAWVMWPATRRRSGPMG